MTAAWFDGAAAVVRAWTRVYTLPLDRVTRHERRREIESDLWELRIDTAADCPSFQTATHVLARAILGVPDDVRWMAEQMLLRSDQLRALTFVRAAAIVIATATVVVSASGPTFDPARALRVNIESSGWLREASGDQASESLFVPALAFTFTNIGDRPTAALQVNAVFRRTSRQGDAFGLGAAFVQVVGWRGLAGGMTSQHLLLHGQGRYAMETAPPHSPMPSDGVDDVYVRLFVHHAGRWTRLGDVPISPLTMQP